MSALLLVLVALTAFLPACYVATALPALWLTQNTWLGERATLLSAGGMEVTLVDGVIVLLLARTLVTLYRTRKLVADRALYAALGAFFLVNFLATLAAAVKFGPGAMPGSLIALARLGSEVALVPILAQTIASPTQGRRCVGLLGTTLLVLAVIQFVNFFGASRGFIIGEVQGMERGEVRYFGPVGDSIGFVLLLGYVVALCGARPVGVLLFAGGIVLTAGLGAVFGLGVATVLVVLFGWKKEVLHGFARRWLWIIPTLLLVLLVAVATVGRPLAATLLDRVQSGRFQESGGQRKATATMALRMIAANPLTGVGFLGYASALERYGGREFFNLDKIDGGTANANNQWLQALTDSGLPGLCAFVAVAATAALRLFRTGAGSADRSLQIFFRGAGLWLGTQLLGNLAAVWLVPSSYVARLLWVMLGIAIALTRFDAARMTNDE